MSQYTDISTRIYHITTPGQWHDIGTSGSYEAPSLASEGFIHCSTRAQLERSLNRFYRGHSTVIVLTIDPALLDSELKYEPADGDHFPHIYGPLNVDAVVVADELTSRDDGTFEVPERVE